MGAGGGSLWGHFGPPPHLESPPPPQTLHQLNAASGRCLSIKVSDAERSLWGQPTGLGGTEMGGGGSMQPPPVPQHPVGLGCLRSFLWGQPLGSNIGVVSGVFPLGSNIGVKHWGCLWGLPFGVKHWGQPIGQPLGSTIGVVSGVICLGSNIGVIPLGSTIGVKH